MTRDHVVRTTPTSFKKFQYDDRCGERYVTWWYYTMKTEERWRSDIIQSDGVRPTYYQAFKWKAKPGKLSVQGVDQGRRYACGGYTTTYRVNNLEGTWHNFGSNTGYPDGMAWDNVPQGVINRARSSAMNKLSPSDLDLSVVFGEGKETLQLLFQSSRKLFQGLHAIKRKDYKALKKIFGPTKDGPAKDVSGLYLQYKFGWRPLMNDIHGAYNLLQKGINEQPLQVKATAVESHLASASTSGRFQVHGTGKKGCQIGISYRVTDPVLAAKAQVGLANPIATAWELVPMSFVFDWFIPVGDILGALGARLGMTFDHGYETRFSSGNMTVRDTDFPSSSYPTGDSPESQIQVSGMERRPLLSWPIPSLYINTGINPGQLVTLLALAQQRS